MFDNSFYKTHDGEVYVKSQCMYRERETIDVLTNILKSKGYITQDADQRIWSQEHKTIIVCLADDFVICNANKGNHVAKWFDSNTTVVTDNYMPHPTDYRVLTFPPSYFGVFNYVPELQTFDPTRRFGLSINRTDDQRILILLELIHQSGGLNQVREHDWINFNGYVPGASNNTKEDVTTNFFKYWDQLSLQVGNKYNKYIPALVDALPIRNHEYTVEQAHVSAYLTLVVETYAGNDTIAFSEKIFRALVTPAPWMLFGARHAVQYLKTLGFDVVDDIIDHSYDSKIQWYPPLAKISDFYKIAEQNYQKLIGMKLSDITTRYQKATTHNQKLLSQFQQQWPDDFKKFLSDLDTVV